ncbi:MAG: glycosyltransferase [Candidatus Omnitrophica bacterium]|nr:glycosyltransferase [Candidatus Omnitrophota bacterium]MDD5237067.1 glycosyltransferase [Candidatus Omnitrophota bacterium]MDD5610193.1 glycosyltransferase [Candidatus Omnitrophota bacterium]
MNNPGKKALIVYASAGAGHFKAAEALYYYLKEGNKGIALTLVDVLEKTNWFFSTFYVWGYSFLVNRAVFLWRFSFWFTSWPAIRKITQPIARFLNRVNSPGFSDYLIKENPDLIISTHFLPSEVACGLKNEGKITSKVITVITDFGVHPFWLASGTDEYIVASGSTRDKLIREGVPQEKIKVLGIPVHPKFFAAKDRNTLCARFGLNKAKFTVLLVTGSFGIGPLEEIVRLLHDDLQVLVVCARNKRLYERLKKKNYPGVHVYAFVDNIEELMVVSDLIITKPGGLSSAEIIVSELVPVFIHPIPGQETENMRVLADYGIGVYAKNAQEVKEIVLDYRQDPLKIERIKNNIRELKKSFRPKEFCDGIC